MGEGGAGPSTPAVAAHLPHTAHRVGDLVVRRVGGGKGEGEGLLIALPHEVGEQLIVEPRLHVEECCQHECVPDPAMQHHSLGSLLLFQKISPYSLLGCIKASAAKLDEALFAPQAALRATYSKT